jgi:hypothetical protein
MFWIYALVLLAVVLGWAKWYDRRKKIRRINAPERLSFGGDMRADFPHEIEGYTRAQDPDRSQH